MKSKKIIAGFLATSLFLTGCGQSAEKIISASDLFENQISHSAQDFEQENSFLQDFPENSAYFAFHNSENIPHHVNIVADSFFRVVDTYFPQRDKQGIMENKTLIMSALDQAKVLESLQVFISYNGEKFTNAQFPSFYQLDKDIWEEKKTLTEDEYAELEEYINTQLCIKASATIDFPMLPVLFESFKDGFFEGKNTGPFGKNLNIVLENPEKNIYIAQLGNCKGAPEFEKIPLQNTFVTVSKSTLLKNSAWKKEILRHQKFFEQMMNDEKQSATQDELKKFDLGMAAIKYFYSEYTKYNSVQVGSATTASLSTFELGKTDMHSKRIISVETHREQNILKEKILGGALQSPFSQQDHIGYSFSLGQDNDTLYFSEKTENLDDLYFPKKLIKAYLDIYTGGSEGSALMGIVVVGILATGATALYTSSQEKARDAVRKNEEQQKRNEELLRELDNKLVEGI